MADNSAIEWTDTTWNPVTGCTPVSPGCKHCYAATMSRRLKLMGQHKYRNGFKLTLHEHTLDAPLEWKKPRKIFVNSMSDLYHARVPENYIRRVFDTMNRANWHQYQLLTKRADRLEQLAPSLPWAPHIWQGVSVENTDYAVRIDHLRRTPAHVKFLSLEPLLGPLPGLDLTGIDWVIVGGESGLGARSMVDAWVREIRDQCVAAKVAFFFKQWGGVNKINKKRAGRDLDGRNWDEMPRKFALPVVD